MTPRRLQLIVLVAALLASGGYIRAGRTDVDNAPPDRALLTRYCVSCHNERLRTGGLVLEGMKGLEDGSSNAETWEKVLRKLRSGQMPPVGLPRPDAAAVATFSTALAEALDRAAASAPNPGRPTVHRLNRTEYQNSIRDLLALDIDVRQLLPADDTDEHGFDNNADVLSVSPALTARYLSAARKISRLALGRGIAMSVETYQVPRLLVQDDRVSERLPFGSRGGAAIEHFFPADGEYGVKIRLQTNNYNYIKGLADEHQIEVRLDRQLVKTFTIGGKKEGAAPASWGGTVYGSAEWERYALEADNGLEARFPIKAGRRVVGVSFVRKSWAPDEILQPRQGGWPWSSDEMFDSNPGIDTVTIEGPYAAAGPSDTPSRRRLFTCKSRDRGCGRTILSTLAHRAYRRPLGGDDVRTLLEFYDLGADQGGFEAGIQLALERILISPDFLFRIESDPQAAGSGTVYRISDIELASRLSFFLWSSGPDDELLAAAERGTLKNDTVLQAQVRRMLADPRSKALVDNFAGQWLVLRNMRNVSPDPDQFPDFDENLRDALQQETELFLESQLREDRRLIELLTADYTFVNERVARHYGIPNVYGNRFRRVPVPDSRGGLLGHASLLTVTSYPNRTSPVLRGKWLLETIVGAPPPPPPPNVPALQDRGEGGKLASVRERLEAHRNNPACSGCHSIMDPLGFALEHFDAVGRWRTSDNGAPVDAAGALPNGAKFEGLGGLRDLLARQSDQFVANVTQNLLAYALGRHVEYYDQPAIRKIARDAGGADAKWSSIILGVVQSMPFQMRRVSS